MDRGSGVVCQVENRLTLEVSAAGFRLVRGRSRKVLACVAGASMAVAKGNVVLPSDLPVEVYGGSPAEPAGIFDDRPTLSELEKRYIALILTECGGNKKRAAERLGIDRRTLYRALERAGVPAGSEDDEEG